MDLETLETLEEVAQNAGKPTREELGKGASGNVYSLQGHVVKEILLAKDVLPHVLNPQKEKFEKEVAIWKELSSIKALRPYLPHFCGAEIKTHIYYDKHRKKHEIHTGYIIQLEETVIDLFELLDFHIKTDRVLNFEYGYTLFKNIIKGFEIMRAAGYLHRDIKPENILIRLDKSSPHYNIPIIIDFGLVCKMPCEERGLVGTSGFFPMNWENITSRNRRKFQGKTKKITIKQQPHKLQPDYSKYSDDYALSIVLRELFNQINWAEHEAEREKAMDEIYKRERGVIPGLAASLVRFKKDKAVGRFFGDAPNVFVPLVPPAAAKAALPPALVPAGKGTKRRRSGSRSASASASAANADLVNALIALREGRSKRARSRSGSAPTQKPALLDAYLSNNA